MDMEKQKNKAKNVPDRLPVLKFFLFGFLVVAVIVTILVLLGPIVGEQYSQIQQTSLPDELYVVAETIYDTIPIDEDVPVGNDIFLDLSHYDCSNWGACSTFGRAHSICIWVINAPASKNLIRNSYFIVNGTRVWGGDGNPDSKCVEGDLEPGLHLIEFHLRDSFFGAPLAIQQWAIEVE